MADRGSVGYGIAPLALLQAGDPVMVCSFGRSGTHLLIDVLRQQFPAFAGWKWPGQSATALFVPLDAVGRLDFSPARVTQTISRSRRAVLKTHYPQQALQRLRRVEPDFAAWLEARAQSIVMVRNPVVAISKVWALHHYWAKPERHAPIYEARSFILAEARRWAEQVETACALPRSLVLRLEDLIAAPAVEIGRLGAFIGETPQMTEPLLVAPHTTRLQTCLARLNIRPRSTHILVPAAVRDRYQLKWTRDDFDTLANIAGPSMARLGYHLRVPGHRTEDCRSGCPSCVPHAQIDFAKTPPQPAHSL